MYHSVLKTHTDPWGLRVSPRSFYEQMAVLRANADPMRLSDLPDAIAANRLPERPVAITFDDGYLDNLRNAKPVLERFGIPATVFVAAGYVDSQREFWWDELELLLLKSPRLPHVIELIVKDQIYRFDLGPNASLSLYDRFKWRRWRAWHEDLPTARHRIFQEVRELLRTTTPEDREQALESLRDAAGRPANRAAYKCVSFDQLRELASGGLIEIGGHTVSHSSLGAMSAERQRDEIINGRNQLEKHLGKNITTFAFPFGGQEDYNADTIRILKDAGFKCSCVTARGSVTHGADPFEYPRRAVLDWSGREFLDNLQKWFEPRDTRLMHTSRAERTTANDAPVMAA